MFAATATPSQLRREAVLWIIMTRHKDREMARGSRGPCCVHDMSITIHDDALHVPTTTALFSLSYCVYVCWYWWSVHVSSLSCVSPQLVPCHSSVAHIMSYHAFSLKQIREYWIGNWQLLVTVQSGKNTFILSAGIYIKTTMWTSAICSDIKVCIMLIVYCLTQLSLHQALTTSILLTSALTQQMH